MWPLGTVRYLSVIPKQGREKTIHCEHGEARGGMISTWMHFTPVTLCPGFAGIESQNKFSLQESCVFEKAEAPALLRRK